MNDLGDVPFSRTPPYLAIILLLLLLWLLSLWLIIIIIADIIVIVIVILLYPPLEVPFNTFHHGPKSLMSREVPLQCSSEKASRREKPTLVSSLSVGSADKIQRHMSIYIYVYIYIHVCMLLPKTLYAYIYIYKNRSRCVDMCYILYQVVPCPRRGGSLENMT